MMILPPSATLFALAFRMKNADLELTLRISVSICCFDPDFWSTYADMVSYSSSVTSANAFFSTLPTVLTTMSIRPNSRIVSAKSLLIAPSVVRSAA